MSESLEQRVLIPLSVILKQNPKSRLKLVSEVRCLIPSVQRLFIPSSVMNTPKKLSFKVVSEVRCLIPLEQRILIPLSVIFWQYLKSRLKVVREVR